MQEQPSPPTKNTASLPIRGIGCLIITAVLLIAAIVLFISANNYEHQSGPIGFDGAFYRLFGLLALAGAIIAGITSVVINARKPK